MAEATVLIVTQDNLDTLRLTVESFRRFNADTDFQLWIWDNNSTDGAQQYARENCDRLFIKDRDLGHHHGQPMDEMCQKVETPYVLVLDNDVRTKAPFLGKMLEEMRTTGAFAINPSCRHAMGQVDHFGRILHGQRRIDPCCAMFETHKIASMTKKVSFTPYECTNLGKFYDTGGLIRQAAEGAGQRIIDAEWVWDCIQHYGAMTWAGYAPDDSYVKRMHKERLAVVREHLRSLDLELRSSTELVLARYGEAVDWTNQIDGVRVTIYNKGVELPEPHAAVSLPNVGREAHTYAHHVATRYDDLAETTIFSQARPFDHVPDFLDQIKKPTAWFRALGPHRLLTGVNGDANHHGLPVGDFYKDLTGKPFPWEVAFAPGACFIVHRNALRRYSKAWWTDLAARLAAPETQSWAPWTIERLWMAVLNAPKAPHRYHEIVGWFTDHPLYRRMVRETSDGAHFVEIGSWVGRSAHFMATEICNSGKRIRFDAVDHFQGSLDPSEKFMRDQAEAAGGSVRGVFESNLKDMLRFVNVVQLSSEEAAKTYADESLDFAFIDAGHYEDEVFLDISLWLPKIKPGGILAGHDFAGAWPGVEKAVRRAFGDNFEFVSPMSWLHRRPA